MKINLSKKISFFKILISLCCLFLIFAKIIVLLEPELKEQPYSPIYEVSDLTKLDYSINSNIPTDLKENILANREKIFVTYSVKEFEKYLTPGYNYEDEMAFLQSLDSINMANANNFCDNITHQQAEEEIEILMDYLKYYYAGYQYFGGEEVFEKLKRDMINDISCGQIPLISIYTEKKYYLIT